MGRQKLLLDLKGKPVIRWSIEGVLPHVDDCIVVTGRDDAALRTALRDLSVRFAVNPRPQDGQGSSIAVGAAALEPSTAAALVVLGDQPLTPPRVIPAHVPSSRPDRTASKSSTSTSRCRRTSTRRRTSRACMASGKACEARL